MAKQPRKTRRLSRELAEMGASLRRLGALSQDEISKITGKEIALDRIARPRPPSPREIVAIREQARMSQAVFARLLDVSTGTLSKWERGELRPRGPASRLLLIIKTKGVATVL